MRQLYYISPFPTAPLIPLWYVIIIPHCIRYDIANFDPACVQCYNIDPTQNMKADPIRPSTIPDAGDQGLTIVYRLLNETFCNTHCLWINETPEYWGYMRDVAIHVVLSVSMRPQGIDASCTFPFNVPRPWRCKYAQMDATGYTCSDRKYIVVVLNPVVSKILTCCWAHMPWTASGL